MSEALNELQQMYYDERVAFFSGWGIAVPTGIIYDKAVEMSDEDCERWFKSGIPKEWKEQLNQQNI